MNVRMPIFSANDEVKLFIETHGKLCHKDNPDEELKINDTILDSVYTRFMNRIKMPVKLRLMYEHIGHPDVELRVGWTVFNSIQFIMENYDKYEKFYDYSYEYIGMGFVYTYSIIKHTESVENKDIIFKRTDGGCNGYERELNLNKSFTINPLTSEFKKMNIDNYLINVIDNIGKPI
jgi:hypothetical protein